MDLTLEVITQLAKLVSTERLDSLRLGDLEIKKSVHEVKDSTSPAPKLSEEVMFAAGGLPPLPPEVEAAFIRPKRRQQDQE